MKKKFYIAIEISYDTTMSSQEYEQTIMDYAWHVFSGARNQIIGQLSIENEHSNVKLTEFAVTLSDFVDVQNT